jgi:hypothetical protein
MTLPVLELVQAHGQTAHAGACRTPPLDQLALGKQHLLVTAALCLGQRVRASARAVRRV